MNRQPFFQRLQVKTPHKILMQNHVFRLGNKDRNNELSRDMPKILAGGIVVRAEQKRAKRAKRHPAFVGRLHLWREKTEALFGPRRTIHADGIVGQDPKCPGKPLERLIRTDPINMRQMKMEVDRTIRHQTRIDIPVPKDIPQIFPRVAVHAEITSDLADRGRRRWCREEALQTSVRSTSHDTCWNRSRRWCSNWWADKASLCCLCLGPEGCP